MIKLTIAGPNKLKLDLDCEPTSTFANVKAQIEQLTGVPVNKQRLLCSGKERKDDKETLAAAKVGAKSKIMLMLAPGYSMPAPPQQAAAPGEDAGAAAEAGEAAAAAPPPVDAEGELPVPPAAAAVEGADEADGAASSEATPGMTHVRQGRNRYHIRVPQGLAAATVGELADYLAPAFLPGIPPGQLRFLAKGGRTAERGDALGAAGAKEATFMLLFREGFHVAADGANWLKESLVELGEAEVQLEKIGRKVDANFTNEDTYMQLQEVSGIVATLRQSVESVKVNEAALPEMIAFRDRVVAADVRAEALRKSLRL